MAALPDVSINGAQCSNPIQLLSMTMARRWLSVALVATPQPMGEVLSPKSGAGGEAPSLAHNELPTQDASGSCGVG